MIREVMMIHGKRCVAIEEAELRRVEPGPAKRNQHCHRCPWPMPRGTGRHGVYPGLGRTGHHQGAAVTGADPIAVGRTGRPRQETLSRLESGRHSPTVRTVEKIEQALKRYAKRGANGAGQGSPLRAAATTRGRKREHYRLWRAWRAIISDVPFPRPVVNQWRLAEISVRAFGRAVGCRTPMESHNRNVEETPDPFTPPLYASVVLVRR